MFVIIMQKKTSIVLNNCQKKGQQLRSPGHGQGCIAGFGRASQNSAAFHTFWEEDQKGLNYSILPKTLQEQQQYNSMDDICYVKSIFWTV